MNEKTYDNFLFFGNFIEIAEQSSNDTNRQNEIIAAICRYGATGEILTDDPEIKGIIRGISYSINKSKKRYNKKIYSGAAGPGRRRKVDYEDIGNMLEEGMTISDIAEESGLSIRQVRNIVKKIKEEILTEIQPDEEGNKQEEEDEKEYEQEEEKKKKKD